MRRSAIGDQACAGRPPWAERTAAELRAAGVAVAPPAVHDVPADLTPQELRIAEPAAGGLTNRDIGTRLYLSHRSHRTIGFHLHKIFRTLLEGSAYRCAV